MTTVAERLGEAHEQLLKLYTSIPVLTPCLESIKSNQAEFVALNNRLRNLQEIITSGQVRAEKTRKQLDSVFTINKGEVEKAYRQEINDIKAYEDERRICLRQRDDVVTVRYRLQKERAILLEETRQLKKITESVFDRSKDEVANTDFPEELYWQLELREYDIKITEVRNSVSKFNTALTSLARAANLTEAALMAFLGYPDAAYKVWRVEYALKASQKMRLYLRVELSLSSAYSNAETARDACPSIVSLQAPPIMPSAAQSYFEPVTKNAKGKYKIVPFDSEAPLRDYIARLRTAHKTAERMLAQETERLNAMQKYRESIIPRLAQIRRHVFQNSGLGGYHIEGWEDAMGRSLLGTEADILVRGGIHNVETNSDGSPLESQARPPLSTSSSQSVPTNNSSDSLEEDEEAMNTVHSRGERRGSGRGVPDVDEQGSSTDFNRPMSAHDNRVVLSVGRAPLSTIAPGNMLGSEVLMQVDRQRQAKGIKDREKVRTRSRSRSGREPEPSLSSGSGSSDHHQRPGSNGFSALGGNSTNGSSSNNNSTSNGSGGGEREGRKKSRGLFSFARGKRGGSSSRAPDAGGDAVVPLASPIFQLSGRNHCSSVDVSNNTQGRMHSQGAGHHRNVPSISISNEDNEDGLPQHPLRRTLLDNASLIQLPSSVSTSTFRLVGASNTNDAPPPFSMQSARPRVMSMDEYVGVGPVVRDGGGDEPIRPYGDGHGSGPLIPSYGEHEQHQSIDPESMMVTSPSGAYNGSGLGSLAEYDEEVEVRNLLLGRTSPPAPPVSSSSPSSVFQPHHRSTQSFHLPLPSEDGRSRSRSLSPQPLSPYSYSMVPAAVGSNSNLSGSNGGSSGRLPYQQHHYSFSDQTPDGSALSLSVPPPDYAVRPPEYSPLIVFPTATSATISPL
ncbi:hypothetical protein EC957_007398 [Mortierella hygrophila]|uniref:Uncharacterized protein n=1 Tax=Mortierella hygrophila TaxID=979708 RepID=A0A9P6EYR1_9FUNG|nr:hypothetical protein EC957_007398 [Mortierella hygrophila]